MSSELPHRRPALEPSAVTIKEVAAVAGVSIATVSRVLNRKGPVSAETSHRVLEAAQTLKYVPHATARSLSTRRTNTVGVVLPDLYGEFFSEVIRGIDVAARGAGYHLLVSGSHSDQREMSAMLGAVRGRVDGVMVMSPDLDPAALSTDMPLGVPMVLLNRLTDSGFGVTIDNYGGARAMVEHLSSLGHKRIGFVGGPEQNADAHERLRGYRDAMEASGAGTSADLEFAGDFSEAAGYAAGQSVAGIPNRPTALFAANDAMAIGALCGLRTAGLSVPDDIALAGFDDIAMARYVNPPLTTVNVSIADLGRRGFELLLEALEAGPGAGRRETLPATLVIRESCGSSRGESERDRKTSNK
jgi:LacI family transcriptional regulator